MKTKQMKWMIFGLFTFMATWMISSCESNGINVTAKLLSPKLPSQLYNYETVTTPMGDISVKSLLQSAAIRQFLKPMGGFFPNTFVDSAMMQSAELYCDKSVQLGRVLFYDKRMSINSTVACGTCHHQELAFSDNMALSAGFGGRSTRRNSMSINNPILFNNLFWDSRAQSTMDLSLRPVFDHIEMGMEGDAMLVNKLTKTDFYPALFNDVFGTPEITRKKVSLLISNFVSSLITMNSKFDVASANNSFGDYNALERLGKDLFFSDRAKCSKCHSGNNFSAPDDPGGAYSAPTVAGTANIGLDRTYIDNGKANGKFRIPSLRNVEMSAPYMHDGRFSSLDQVVDHYSRGIQAHEHLDANLKDFNGKPIKMNFTPEEKDALIAFLRTLTDVTFITEKRYSDPFVN